MIREATEKDAEAIAEIYNYYIQKTVVTFEEEDLDEYALSERMHKVQMSGFSWLVAVENEKIIGYSYSSEWNGRGAYKSTAEVSVYLSPSLKAKGWGTKLYQALFSRLRDKSIHVVIGGITLPNPASIAIHEKFGMEKVAHFKEIGYKFGQWLDVGYWQVKLNV
ncbi:MAG: GNAT family N-acetyltransferase [Pseudomonadales bacterium]|nr:GNAT family N-acetyltransferase [Pseudomonadales bacterium]